MFWPSRDKLIAGRAAMAGIRSGMCRLFLYRRLARILRDLCCGRARISAVVDHRQTVSAVAPGKVVEGLYSVYSPQA